MFLRAAGEAAALDLKTEDMALAETTMSEETSQMMARAQGKRGDAAPLAKFAAAMLRDQYRIAAFSISGWDTHNRQEAAIRRPLRQLSTALRILKAELGPAWEKTGVIALTEFGRTARQNGAKGTDHGTGGAALLAGGAISGGKVWGKWPGLSSSDLYKDRDLMPTDDLRRYPAWMLAGLFGIDRSQLESTVFPGLDVGDRLDLIG
jgi:uncharacterized protein (DUF1501 family)